MIFTYGTVKDVVETILSIRDAVYREDGVKNLALNVIADVSKNAANEAFEDALSLHGQQQSLQMLSVLNHLETAYSAQRALIAGQRRGFSDKRIEAGLEACHIAIYICAINVQLNRRDLAIKWAIKTENHLFDWYTRAITKDSTAFYSHDPYSMGTVIQARGVSEESHKSTCARLGSLIDEIRPADNE